VESLEKNLKRPFHPKRLTGKPLESLLESFVRINVVFSRLYKPLESGKEARTQYTNCLESSYVYRGFPPFPPFVNSSNHGIKNES
jgi:hypothetical protein